MSEETAAADGARGDEIDAIAVAVREVPGVADLHAGVLGEVASRLPGQGPGGLSLSDSGCEVHLTLEWGAEVEATTDAVRDAVRAFVSGPVDVMVEDIVPATEAAAADGAP